MENNVQAGRKDLQDIALLQYVSKVEVKEVTLPPGMAAPRHLHPCPVMGVVKSGTVLFQIEGEEPRYIPQGEVFYEPRNKTILHFDNASSSEPLVFIAFYLKEADEPGIELL